MDEKLYRELDINALLVWAYLHHITLTLVNGSWEAFSDIRLSREDSPLKALEKAKEADELRIDAELLEQYYRHLKTYPISYNA